MGPIGPYKESNPVFYGSGVWAYLEPSKSVEPVNQTQHANTNGCSLSACWFMLDDLGRSA